MNKQRVQWIDRLKGFAMLAVVIAHLGIFGLYTLEDPVCYLMESFHMPVFFFLSGLVLSGALGFRKLMVKLCRFLCPMAVIGYLYIWFTGKSYLDLWFDPMKSGYWYLFVLSIFYFCTFVYTSVNQRVTLLLGGG